MVSIAVMGHGVVGSGVVEVLYKNQASIDRRAGEEIRLKYVLDLLEFPGLSYSDKFIKDFTVIENDPEISVVVEVMGGLNPAYDFVKRCLLAGKSVVTSNKELVAAKGEELLAIARERNVNFLFEASVGGGIPIIRPISQCLAANEIMEILGILNGTTNFILTKMFQDGMSFEESLSLAQKLGYAERNPDADVGGHDTCRKICILASLAFGKHVYPEQVSTEGITGVTALDVAYAASHDYAIKLIGQVKKLEDGRIQCLVAPMLVPGDSQLSSVDDVFNAIVVRGDATGDVMFYGKGAGKLPTASAVVADVIDCVKHRTARKYLYWGDGSPDYVDDVGHNRTALYVRAKAADPALALQKVSETFGPVNRLQCENAPANELAFVLPAGTEQEIRGKLQALGAYLEPAQTMRVCE